MLGVSAEDEEIDCLQEELANYVINSTSHSAVERQLQVEQRIVRRNVGITESLRRFDEAHGANLPRRSSARTVRAQSLSLVPIPPQVRPQSAVQDGADMPHKVCSQMQERKLRQQLAEATETYVRQREAIRVQEERYEGELLVLSSQKRSRRASAAIPQVIEKLKNKTRCIQRFCSAAARRREAKECDLMSSYDVASGRPLRADALTRPSNPATVVATGSVPPDVADAVIKVAVTLHGVILPHKTILIVLFSSMCSAYQWTRKAQHLLRTKGWGTTVLKEHGGTPQLTFGMSYGPAETILTAASPYSHPVVATAVRYERAARVGEVVMCRDAAAELDSFRRSIHEPMFADCMLASYAEGTCLALRDMPPRARTSTTHVRQISPLDEHASRLECTLMSLEDQHLAVKAPTGTVTIAFTDIQSSVQLWETYAHSMKAAHEMHNDTLRSLLEIHSGYEVKNEGDAFMVAFSDVVDAMEWCMSVQHKLLELNWPSDLLSTQGVEDVVQDDVTLFHGLRVRMGFTTGEPECTVDPVTGRMDYFGPMVNLAARISGQGKGGETIIGSQAMAALRQKQGLPAPDVVVTGKGTKILKGISKEETMFQLFPRTLARRKEVQVKSEKKKNVWNNILSSRPKRQKKVLDAAKQTSLLELEKRAPKIFLRNRQLLRTLESREKVFMRTEDHSTLSIPPTGSVSLVFTDIQSSTLIWDTVPNVMEKVLELHNRLLRDLISEYDGYEVKTEGDAFMVAFRGPEKALAWCVAAQHTLLNARWPKALNTIQECCDVFAQPEDTSLPERCIFSGPRVRMGFNTGEPMCEVDSVTHRMDYLGPIVNNAARVSSNGAGGEIVIGHEAYTKLLKLDDALDGTVFRDVHIHSLGEVVLKGIAKPEPLYSMVPEYLRERRKSWKEKSVALPNKTGRDVLAKFQNATYSGEKVAKSTAELQAIHTNHMGHVKKAHDLHGRPFHDLNPTEVVDFFENVHIVVKAVGYFVKLLLEGEETSGAAFKRDLEESITKLQAAYLPQGEHGMSVSGVNRQRIRSLKQTISSIRAFSGKGLDTAMPSTPLETSRRVSASRRNSTVHNAGHRRRSSTIKTASPGVGRERRGSFATPVLPRDALASGTFGDFAESSLQRVTGGGARGRAHSIKRKASIS